MDILNIVLFVVNIIVFFTNLRKNHLDTQQSKIQNTNALIHSFFETEALISKEDKKNWDFLRGRVLLEGCGYQNFYKEKEFRPYDNGDDYKINKIFTEGEFEHLGRSVINVLNVLEYISTMTCKGVYDKNLIKIHFLSYLNLSKLYIEVLNEDKKGQDFNKILKLLNQNKFDNIIIRDVFGVEKQ